MVEWSIVEVLCRKQILLHMLPLHNLLFEPLHMPLPNFPNKLVQQNLQVLEFNQIKHKLQHENLFFEKKCKRREQQYPRPWKVTKNGRGKSDGRIKMSTRNGSKAERQNADCQTGGSRVVHQTHMTAHQLPGRRHPAHTNHQQETPHHLSQNLDQNKHKTILEPPRRHRFCNWNILSITGRARLWSIVDGCGKAGIVLLLLFEAIYNLLELGQWLLKGSLKSLKA